MNRKSVLDLKAFVPAKDFTLAKQFYVDLGFSLLWGSEELAAFQVGEFRFLLQNYYVEQWASNFMMHLLGYRRRCLVEASRGPQDRREISGRHGQAPDPAAVGPARPLPE